MADHSVVRLSGRAIVASHNTARDDANLDAGVTVEIASAVFTVLGNIATHRIEAGVPLLPLPPILDALNPQGTTL